MTDFDDILKIPPYSLESRAKQEMLTEYLRGLTKYHADRCGPYRKILDALGVKAESIKDEAELPFLPVRLFKDMDLKSIDDKEIYKVLTSSGTTGQLVSKIYLDRRTASNQQKALVKTVSDFTGQSRMPMLIIDCPSVIKDRSGFSARGAGIAGFSIFASDRMYALDDAMQINIDGIQTFLKKHEGRKILLFGFTFMIWQYFYKALLEYPGIIDLSGAVLIHGGGWKKLAKEAVEPHEFKACLQRVCGLSDIHDYYGMAEQTGSIYMQCEYGHLHAGIFSDVIMRRMSDFTVCGKGEKGVIQVLSLLPESYPGHSILTEDEGILLGEDDCPCGRKGKYFKVLGRIKNAEVRGCSDTYEKP